MKKRFENLIRLYSSGGISEADYLSVSPLIWEINYKNWLLIGPAGSIFFAVLFILSFRLNSITPNSLVYLAMMLLFLAVSLYFHSTDKKDSPAVIALVYLLNFLLLLYAIAIGVIHSPEYLAVTFMVMLVALPLVTLDRPYRMVLLSTVSSLIFVVLCLIFKSGEILEIELVNITCFWLISLVIHSYIASSRIRSYLWMYTIEEDSRIDPLTRVKNNAAYSRLKVQVEGQIHEKTAEPFALVVCDVNGLKTVNDSQGHEKGDIYLQRNCREICRIFRHSPVYRIGGDEFLVYLKGLDYEQRERLMSLAAAPRTAENYALPIYEKISFACGIAEYDPEQEASFTDVFRKADGRMYEAKKRMHNADPEEALPETTAADPTPTTDRKTILVIGADTQDRNFFRTYLSDQYDLLQAQNEEKGLQLLQERYEEISLILLELFAPAAALACDFLTTVHKDPLFRAIPVIVASPEDRSAETEGKVLGLGAADFIAGPYHPGVLIGRVGNAIRTRESTALLREVAYDRLTGLYTKEAFYHYAALLLRKNPETQYDLYLSDVDNFKSINEKYGSAAGDQILKGIAQRLKEVDRYGVLSARYGNDQFVSLVPAWENRNVPEVIAGYEAALDAQTFGDMRLTGKVGVYEYVAHDLPVPTLCDRAMLAMRKVKHRYGVVYACYDSELHEAQEQKFHIEQSMQEAYETGQFRVYYQPKHDVKTEKLIGAEALVRWQHPTYGFMRPDRFIPLFEENGFISMLDYYVWKRTIENLKKWSGAGLPVVPISVNSSRRDFEHENYLQQILLPLEGSGVDHSLLHIEITESVFIENMQSITDKLQQCRDAGFAIELDDFGAGYSSLTALSSLPLDVLKLDMSFIRQSEDKKKAEILAAAISLGKKLGYETIAEGVETKEQRERLLGLGCDQIQGYYYSKPLTEEEFAAYLAKYAAE